MKKAARQLQLKGFLKKQMNKRFILVTISVIFVFLFSSCQAESQIDKYDIPNIDMGIYNKDSVLDKGPQSKGELKLFCTYPDTFSPLLTKNIHLERYSYLVFESMVKLDSSQKPVPVLSDSWSVSDDGLSWTFHIRDDVYWHDGVVLTANDVEFTIDKILETNSIYKKRLSNITAYAATNLDLLTVTLKKPNSFTPELMTFPIVPKHSYKNSILFGINNIYLPIGTGPYMYSEYEDRNYITLKAYDKWWNKDITIPSIKIILFKEDKEKYSAFQTYECDVLSVESLKYEGYNNIPGILSKEYAGNNFEFIAFNTKNKVFGNKNIRKAISYAIDTKEIISDLLDDMAVESDYPILPGSWVNNEKTYHSYDKSKAVELLKENGRRSTTSIEILVNSENEIRLKAAEIIKKQLEEIGIKIKIKQAEWKEVMELVSSGRYEMVLMGCRLPVIPDMSLLYSKSYFLADSNNIEYCSNISQYMNKEADRLITKIFSEYDNNKKQKLYDELFDILNEDMPYMGLYIYKNALVVNEYVRGSINPHIWDIYNDITGWYITER
jgi:peptide/nickel transport system substrate-binding protein